MSELLQFPLHHNKHRRPSDKTVKQKVMRAVGTGLFLIGAYTGIKHGIDAATEDQPEQLPVAASIPNRITSDEAHAAAHNAILETIDDMEDVMYAVGGMTVAIGVGVVGLARAASRNEHQDIGSALIPPDLAIVE